jgi:hypothetical protein
MRNVCLIKLQTKKYPGKCHGAGEYQDAHSELAACHRNRRLQSKRTEISIEKSNMYVARGISPHCTKFITESETNGAVTFYRCLLDIDVKYPSKALLMGCT